MGLTDEVDSSKDDGNLASQFNARDILTQSATITTVGSQQEVADPKSTTR